MKTIHYVANVVVKRVEIEDGRNAQGTYAPVTSENFGKMQGRRVGDVISLVIRGSDFDSLRTQLKDHLLVATDDINVPLDEEKGQLR